MTVACRQPRSSYLDPGHQGKEEEEYAGSHLAAGKILSGFLSELNVHKENCHLEVCNLA